jgi:hypothetical protein
MVTLISERDDNPKIMIIAKTGRATTTYRLIPVLLSKIPFSSEVNQHILFELVTPTEQIYSNVEDVLFSEGLKMFSLLAGTMGCYCGSNSFSYQMEQNSKQRSENENTGVV